MKPDRRKKLLRVIKIVDKPDDHEPDIAKLVAQAIRVSIMPLATFTNYS